jgi:iron complex transport system permease protein
MSARLLIMPALALAITVSLLLPWNSLAALFEADQNVGWAVLLELRLPRTALALVYGAMLGAAGAAIQALFANPLASPDLTGTTSGAALGAVVTAYLVGASGTFAMAIGAVAGAAGSLGLLIALAGRRADTSTLLLAGLAISALAGALTTLALALAPSPFAFYDAYSWLMGSLVDRSLTQLAFAAVPAILAIIALARLSLPLDRLALGEEVAESMGHDLARLRLQIICLSALGSELAWRYAAPSASLASSPPCSRGG